MAAENGTSLIGVGIYTIPEAARLTAVSAGRIRRWLKGYQFTSSGAPHVSPAVWSPQLPAVDGRMALGFLDLMEVRFVDAFLEQGVSWPTLRKAAIKARELVASTHPFSTQRFRTDGRLIFAELSSESGDRSLLELTKNQQYFDRIITPYLRGVEFVADEPVRWYPMGSNRRVVIDPVRGFGQPIVASRGIPTAVLAQAVKAHGSISLVAGWYETDEQSVRDAVRYEQTLSHHREAA